MVHFSCGIPVRLCKFFKIKLLFQLYDRKSNNGIHTKKQYTDNASATQFFPGR